MTNVCFRITPTSPDAIRSQLDLVEHHTARWWAEHGDGRILCHLRPVGTAEQLAGLPVGDDWRAPYQIERRDRISQQHQPTYQLDTYIALWNTRREAGLVEAGLREAWHVPHVEHVPFPHLVGGRYTPHLTHLAPGRAGDPYYAVLTAHGVSGGWALVPITVAVPGQDRLLHCENWHALLRLDLPLVVAIDVQAMSTVEAKQRYAVLKNRPLHTDEAKAQQLLEQAADSARVHLVRIAVLVAAQRLPELHHRIQQVEQASGRRVQLERMHGMQDAHIRFFTDTPPSQIATPAHARNTPSYLLASQTPLAVRRTPVHQGIPLGRDMDEGVDVAWDPFGPDERENGSTLILGPLGKGKSVLVQKILLGHLQRRYRNGYGQGIYIDPGDDAWRLAHAVGDSSACAFHHFDGSQALNPLDVHSTNVLEQWRMVQDVLRMGLGTVTEGGNKQWSIQPRDMDRAEQRALMRSLQHPTIYGEKYVRLEELTTDTAPRLSMLLPLLHTNGAHDLAEDIESRLLELAPDVWDRPTQLHFDPSKDLTLYHVRDVPKALLPLWYMRLFNEVYRYILTRETQTRTPLFFLCDEWWIASMIETLRLRAIATAKDARKYGLAMGFVDQHAEVVYTGDATLPGLPGACRHKFFFALDGLGLDLVKKAHAAHLSLGMAQQIPRLGRGQCMMVGDETRRLTIELTDLEKRTLIA